MNLENIYTSPYRFFNFQQLFFYDIVLRNAKVAYFRVIGRQSIYVYMIVLDRHKIQDSSHSNKWLLKWVLPYPYVHNVLSNEGNIQTMSE